MRTLALNTALLIFIAFQSQAQGSRSQSGWRYGNYFEQTAQGSHIGTSAMYDFKYTYPGSRRIYSSKIGAFYQRSLPTIADESSIYLKERSFVGLTGEFELVSTRFISADLNARIGVQNKKNFLISPSVLATLKPLKNVAISGGFSLRGFSPSTMIKLTISLDSSKY